MHNIMSFRNTLEQKKIRRQQRLERKSNFETKYGKFTHISEFNAKAKEAKQKQQEFFDKVKMQMNNLHEHFVSKALNLKDLIKSL